MQLLSIIGFYYKLCI